MGLGLRRDEYCCWWVVVVGVMSLVVGGLGETMSTTKTDDSKFLGERVGLTAMKIWNESSPWPGPGKDKWNYEFGVLMLGIESLWRDTHDWKYVEFIQRKVDHFVTEKGEIPTFVASDYALDSLLAGRALLFLYRVTGLEKYRTATGVLRLQLDGQPRTKEGVFWHKLIYPYQNWLDGLYTGTSFWSQYAAVFGETEAFDDIANQFIVVEKHTRDNVTGLLYAGYDEARQQPWANPVTGDSASFWGRGIGWYMMALVDTLEFLPPWHPKKVELIEILERLATAITNFQDPETGLWYQVVDKKDRAPPNYLESSASSMFVKSLAQAVRLGYLPKKYKKVAKRGYKGIGAVFIGLTTDGGASLARTVLVGGLGGSTNRNGTFEYYMSEPVVTNDAKGMGPFMMASTEIKQKHTFP